MSAVRFEPWEPLVEGEADSACRAVVIVPARNEESLIAATLNALSDQVDRRGRPLDRSSFEILLLLNNCTDQTASVVSQWKIEHLDIGLHVVERTLTTHEAFVGTARRLLMDTAWRRLASQREVCGIFSTDSDTQVSADWIAQNMAALEAGADAVGGVILLRDTELQSLPLQVQQAYLRDREYQRLVALLEDRLNPQDGDPWPRHLEHFGASLAVTPEAYARAGGMPPITPLEDVAFVRELRRTGAKLRHQPEVKVYTSSRLHGRVNVGLSGQLRCWKEMSERGEQHEVDSASWIAHRFRTLERLRIRALRQNQPLPTYLEEVDSERLIAKTFRGKKREDITGAIRRLSALLENSSAAGRTHLMDNVPEGPADIPRGVAG